MHVRKVQRWIAERNAVDVPRTEFSKQEVADAEWFELTPNWHYGYPQPNEETLGYRQGTYDLSEYCAECGVGLKQKAPFQLKGEPKWGRNGILQLSVIHESSVVTDGLPMKRCATCAQTKYMPVAKGFFPALASSPMAQMIKSSEYFGDGAAVSKRVLVARDIGRALLTENVRGASLRPVAK